MTTVKAHLGLLNDTADGHLNTCHTTNGNDVIAEISAAEETFNVTQGDLAQTPNSSCPHPGNSGDISKPVPTQPIMKMR